MIVPAGEWIPDLLQESWELLETLWAHRLAAFASPQFDQKSLARLDERIEAHTDHLVLAGDHALPLVKPALMADDANVALAAAFVLLKKRDDEAAHMVWAAFLKAKGACRSFLHNALCFGPIDPLRRKIVDQAESSNAEVALDALAILILHKERPDRLDFLDRFLKHKDAPIRHRAWKLAALLVQPLKPAVYLNGMQDPDLDARRDCFWAAAAAAQKNVLDPVRRLAFSIRRSDVEAGRLLAVLARPDELSTILSFANDKNLGPERFAVLGSFGHPDAAAALLPYIADPDFAVADAAAQAFTKITGLDVLGDKKRLVLPPDGHEPDDFEKEFLDEVKLPDPQKAEKLWKDHAPRFRSGTRWCRGHDLTQGCPPNTLIQLDHFSHWEACVRGKFDGTWQGNLVDLFAIPQTA